MSDDEYIPGKKHKRSSRVRQNPNRKAKRKAPSSSEDDEEEQYDIKHDTDFDYEDEVMLTIADLLPMFAERHLEPEETVNEKYLKTLSKRKRQRLETEEKRIIDMNTSTIPIRYKILGSQLPTKTKAVVMQKVEQFENSHAGASGHHKLKVYMDRLLQVPFGIYHSLPINNEDNREQISSFLYGMKTTLDQCIYGQTLAKSRLIEVAGKWITNPESHGNIIGLLGPPGVGKTTLIKKGLSKAIGIPFAFFPLGGCSNPSILEGHDYTYEGSKNGKLVDILIENKCMNPIIFFDELDKLGDTPAGRDISGVLTHLTDFTQNDSIHDRYFADIEFDFSKCLFIFSFNDHTKINPILKDRITMIEMKGFNRKEKLEIAKKFSIPKYMKEIGLIPGSFSIDDDVLEFIVDTYCAGEQGIRKLEKCLESIMMKLNIYNLTGDKKFVYDIELGQTKKVGKKLVSKILNELFNINESVNLMARMMYN